MTDTPKDRRLVRKFFGVVCLFLAILLIFAKALVKFPIGLFTTANLLLSDNGSGNVGHLLGVLTGDFLLFAACIFLLYLGVKLLKNPKLQNL